MYYAGVGSRNTPKEILDVMTKLAEYLYKLGYTLRSGGASGADTAFEAGAYDAKEIFYAKDCTVAAMAMAEQYHPAWNRCGYLAKQLHGRNSMQILGRNLNDPVDFVVCWTPDGCLEHATRDIVTGGTGTAISIASEHEIEVLNLAHKPHLNRAMKKIT